MTLESAESRIDDRSLLAEYAANRDPHAFRTLVKRYHRLVFSICYRGLNRNIAAAEDASQAVFIILSRKAPQINPDKLSGWIFKTSLQVTHTLRREERRRKKREARLATSDTTSKATTGDHLDREALSKALHVAISELPPRQRDALLLYYFGGLDQQTIGARLGCSAKAVQKRIEYALAALRSRLDRQHAASVVGSTVLAMQNLRNLKPPTQLFAKCATAGATPAAAAPAALRIADLIMRRALLKLCAAISASSATVILLLSLGALLWPTRPAPAGPAVGAAIPPPAIPAAAVTPPPSVAAPAPTKVTPAAAPLLPSPPAAQPAADTPFPADADGKSAGDQTAGVDPPPPDAPAPDPPAAPAPAPAPRSVKSPAGGLKLRWVPAQRTTTGNAPSPPPHR